MLAAVLLILAALIGVGGGYGAFQYTKALKPPEIASLEQEKAAQDMTNGIDQSQQVSSLQEEEVTKISIKHFYDNDELTKEGAVLFLQLRAQMHGLPPEKVKRMIEELNRMSKKIPVIEAFKVVAIQYRIMDFREFKEPRIHGL